jgi:hypothetical protein
MNSPNEGSRKKRRFYSLDSEQRPVIKKKMGTYNIEKFLVRTTIPLHI